MMLNLLKIDRFWPLAPGVILAVLLAASAAQAQLTPGGGGESKGPIAISADRMDTDDQAGLVTFIGSVVARQGSMTITCDLMKVFYIHEEPSPAKAAAHQADPGQSPFGDSDRQIDRVECEGNVKVVDGDRLAVAKKGLYLARSTPRRIILTDEARVWQGRDSLTGHQITYMLDEKRSVAESGPPLRGAGRERVRTIFHQGE